MVVGEFFSWPQKRPRKNSEAARDVDVWVHVYDLGVVTKYFLNSWMPFSQGAYHVGIEVFGMEWCFHATPYVDPEYDFSGVHFHLPKQHPVHYFRESVFLGRSPLPRAEVRKLFLELPNRWRSSRYHYLHCNCVDFAEHVHSSMRLPNAFPSWARGCSKGWLQSTPLASGFSPFFSSCGSVARLANSGDVHIEAEPADGEVASTGSVDTGSNDGETLLSAEKKHESCFPGPARQSPSDNPPHTARRASALDFPTKCVVAINDAGRFHWPISLLSSGSRAQARAHRRGTEAVAAGGESETPRAERGATAAE